MIVMRILIDSAVAILIWNFMTILLGNVCIFNFTLFFFLYNLSYFVTWVETKIRTEIWQCYIPVNSIVAEHGAKLCENLPTSHVLTECHNSSATVISQLLSVTVVYVGWSTWTSDMFQRFSSSWSPWSSSHDPMSGISRGPCLSHNNVLYTLNRQLYNVYKLEWSAHFLCTGHK
jgi:hypothetical protein